MSSQETQDQPPLWEYVTKLEKQGKGGGVWKFTCNRCSETRQGSYSRVRAHLLGIKGTGIATCKSTTAGDRQKMKQLEDAYEKKKAESNAKEVALPCEGGVGFKKRKGSSTPIERAFGVEIRDQLDQEIARMFYTEGLPFNLARNPHYLRAFQFVAANKIDGYVPPSYNKLRTTLLQKEKDNVHRQLEPLRSTWKEKGVTNVSDPTRKPLINFMATSGNGPLFLNAVNCFGEVKDRFFIANLMKEVINEIGHQNVVQIITDNAANCKAAGQLIESQFPHIYWTPCVVHTLNLAVKNICSPNNVETNALAYEQCSWIKDVHGDALAIKNFIMNHNMRLSI
ncbi:hAT dimerization domain, ribonuclease H-like domain protein, partial [Tanacetum coccineum]